MKTIHLVDDNGDPDLGTKIAIGVEAHQTFGNGGNTKALSSTWAATTWATS